MESFRVFQQNRSEAAVQGTALSSSNLLYFFKTSPNVPCGSPGTRIVLAPTIVSDASIEFRIASSVANMTPAREIRTLRVMWRELETALRRSLLGHDGRNSGYGQGIAYRVTAPALGPTTRQPAVPRKLSSGLARHASVAIRISQAVC